MYYFNPNKTGGQPSITGECCIFKVGIERRKGRRGEERRGEERGGEERERE